MKELNYSELSFIENALTYFRNQEIRMMEENSDVYSIDEITKFHSSVQELIDKISKIKKEKGE